MAIIDYLGIENAIKNILDNDSRTNSFGGKTTTIEVEGEFMLNEVKCPYIAIFLDSYETLADTETIGGATPYLTSLSIQIWCYDFSLENLSGATNRDTMLGKVKEVLKENKTLDNNVLYFKFTSGVFDNQKNTSGLGFFKGVSLNIDCEVKE
jgi:hypothetical protein|tara:strand:+ start:1345 stop:1800 length:456 start_codon:yes stop_codon:yes gene_type:complete